MYYRSKWYIEGLSFGKSGLFRMNINQAPVQVHNGTRHPGPRAGEDRGLTLSVSNISVLTPMTVLTHVTSTVQYFTFTRTRDNILVEKRVAHCH
jgi:hypothetical protein